MEKRQRISASIALGAVVLLMLAIPLKAQPPCFGGTSIGTITPTIAWQTHPCIKGGEYLEFNAVAGKFYTFSFCMAGGAATFDTQITILDGAGGDAGGIAEDECFLQSHLSYWFCSTSGTYRVLVSEYNCQAGTTCGTMAYKVENDPGGPGITCGNPYVIPSLPFNAGGLSTCGFGYDYSSANACGSTYMNDEDFVFQLSGTAGQCISIFTENTFTYTGLFLVRGCPSAGGSTCIAFDEASAGVPYITNVTLPTTATYYIIVDGYDAAFPDCTPFDIEIMNCIGVGQGNNCGNAFTIPSVPYSQNGFTTCGKGNTYDSGDACGSPYMDGEDFMFRYVSPTNQCVSINVNNSFSYTGVFVYNGCPDAGGTTCIAQRGDPSGDPEIRQVNMTAGTTYYIMVSTWPAPNCTPFNLVISPCTPGCTRNPNANDLCSAATVVSLSLGDTVCGVANYYFTPDVSGDLTGDFCGSIENNSWFAFVADSTQMTLRIDVPDCMSGFGLQCEIFQTSNCNTFTPVSNCWNPQYQTTGFMQATSLVVGQTYYFMVDGYAGDDCEFQITRLGQGPLPVEWAGISATAEGNNVQIDWSVYSEQNVRGYYVQRGQPTGTGRDDMRWTNAGYVACPNNSQGRSYSFDDTPPYNGATWYYRVLEQDFDGMSDFSEVVEVTLAGPDHSVLRDVYPVPATESVNINYYASQAGNVRIAVYDMQGRLMDQQEQTHAAAGTHNLEFKTTDYADGTYFFVLAIGLESLKGKFEILH